MFGLIEKVYNGTTDVFGGAGGFLSDVLRAGQDLGSGNIGEAAETIMGSVEEDLMGGVMGGLFGPDGIGGGIIGAVPETLRDVGRPVFNSIFGAWDWTIQEVVDRPLGTIFTMVSPGALWGNPMGLIDPSQWARAYEINDKRTFGQSFTAAAYLIDPFDEDEYNSIKDDPIFNLISGTADFAQEFIDPVTYIGGAGVKLARGSAVIGKAGSGVGRTFANPSRLGGHLLPRTGELAPKYIVGRELGYRPSTILGKTLDKEFGGKFSFLTKTDKQRGLREQYGTTWTKARADAVLDSPEWNRIEAAIAARANVKANDRFNLFRQGLGRRGTKLPEDTLRLIANGPSREARARTFRMLAGDYTVWNDIGRDATHYLAFLRDPSGAGRAAAQDVRTRINLEGTNFADQVDYRTSAAVMDDMAALADSTDWALVAAFEDSMILSQQKKYVYDAKRDGYFMADQVHETLKEVPVDIQIAGLEDLLGVVDDVLDNAKTGMDLMGQQRYMGVSIKDMPKGKRFAELLARHRDELMTNDFVVSEYVNPRIIGGRNSKIRLMTAKISRTHIDHTGPSAFNDFEVMLSDASRMVVDGDRAITQGEVGNILGQYQGYLTDGNFDAAADLFADVNARLMKWVDDTVDFYEFKDANGNWLDSTMRTMTDDYNQKMKKWRDPEQTRILSVTDFEGLKRKDKKGAGALRHEKDVDGNTTLIQYGMSPSQLRNSDIMPRYDVIQAHIEKAIRRGDNKFSQKADDTFRRIGSTFQTTLQTPNDLWRASVLLTPKWPMRVGLDEQLRLMVNLGTLQVVAEFDVAFGRMRRTQEYSRLSHNAGDVADTELLGAEMNSIILESGGVDTMQQIPLDPIYDPVVEELVRGKQVVNLAEATPEQKAKYDRIKGDVEVPELDEKIEPQNLSKAEALEKEAEIEAGKARGRERRAKKQIEADLIHKDFLQTKAELRELSRYAAPGQEAIPPQLPNESAMSYRARLERELNDRYKRRRAEQVKAQRQAEGLIAAEPAPFGGAPKQPATKDVPQVGAADETGQLSIFATEPDALAGAVDEMTIAERRRLREEGIQEGLPDDTPIFEMPASIGQQRMRMAEIRPDINFLGINFRQRGDLPQKLGMTPNAKGHMTVEGYMPGEVLLDVQGSPTFRMPRHLRTGARHPDRAAAYDAIAERIKGLEAGQQRTVVYRSRIPNEVLPEYADYAGRTRRSVNQQRKRNGLPEFDEQEFVEFIEQVTGKKQVRSGAEAEALEPKGQKAKPSRNKREQASRRMGKSADPVDAAKVSQELEALRSQLANLAITAEESVDMYRHWVTNRLPEGSSPEYAAHISIDQGYVDTPVSVMGPNVPIAERVRQALRDGDLNGMTLIVENMDRPHHGRVLNELQVQLDPRPVMKVAITGSNSIANADAIWAMLDDIWIENSQHRRLELIVMPDKYYPSEGAKGIDNGKGIDAIAYQWAEDRGVAVHVYAITADGRIKGKDQMRREFFEQRGYIGTPVKQRKKKRKEGQGGRDIYPYGQKEQVIYYTPEQNAEFDIYHKALWSDAARKRNNLVLDEADFEIIFSHDRAVDPKTGKRPSDNKVFFASQAFKDARALDPTRPNTQMVTIPEAVGFEPISGTRRIQSRVRSKEDAAAQAAAQAEETLKVTTRRERLQMEAYYEDLARNDPYVSDRFSDEIVAQVEEDLIAEFGADYDPQLLLERLEEVLPALDGDDVKPIDVSDYQVSEAEMLARERIRDEEAAAAYRAEQERPLPEEDVPEVDEAAVTVANTAAESRETFFETQYDYERQYAILGAEGVKKAADRIVQQRVLRGRNERRLRRNAGIKMLIGTGVVFGNPVLGAAWGFMSYMSKRKKIRTAAQQKAALAYGSALRQQGRQMLDEVVSFEDQAVARAMMSDADYIQKLIDDEVRNASKIKSALDAADELMDEAGFPSLQIGNMSFRSAFGDDQRYTEQIHRQMSANGGMSAIYSGIHKHQQREMERFGRQKWERSDYTNLRTPRDPNKLDSSEFAENFDRLANLYTSSSGSKPFYAIVWSNKSVPERVDALYELLTNKPEVLKQIVNDRGKHRGVWDDIGREERRAIAENIVKEYENVLPSQYFPELRQRARAGKFTWNDVERRLDQLIEDGTLLGGVPVPRYKNARQEAVAELREQGYGGFGKAIAPERTVLDEGQRATVGRKLDEITSALFERYGAIPSDELARHPFFKAVYEREMRRTIEPMLDADGYVNISQKQIDRIENSARTVALRETKRVLYELGESSRLAELLGNASPFFNAWQEVLSRWGGFAVDNPMFVGNVARLYRKPWEAEALGLGQFEDENGNTYVTLRLFGDAFDEDGNQRTILDVMPQSIKDYFIPPILSDSESTLRFSKNGINTMMQITPGAGPLVVIPARETVLANPELEPTLDFLFPFGHPPASNFFERTVISNLPTWQKASYDLIRNNTHSRDAVTARMFQDVVLEMQARGVAMDWADEGMWNELQLEAESRANQFFMFRIAAGLFSPTSTTWQSPYQPYMDAYNQLEQEHGWRMAQTMFLDRFGEEFYAATATFTKSNDGIASSLEAEELYNEYTDLIQGEGAAVGDWITGSMGSTAERYRFSQSVFYNQMNTPIAPGSDTMRRERKTGREAISDTMEQLGWRKYTEGRNFVRMHQDRAVAAGMSPSLNANHMEGVARWWQAYKDELEASNPVWASQFNDVFGAIDRMNDSLNGFIAGLEYESIRNRPSSRHLLEYLQMRMFVQDQLEEREALGGSNNLKSGSNADLFDYWAEQKYDFSMRPEFEAIFDRYFERDVIDPLTFIDPADLPPGWFV